MADDILVVIDGIEARFPAGTTILKAAQAVGVSIPTLCYHDYCTANALCRICVVEVEGARTLIPACVGQVSPNLHVHTRSDRVLRSRRVILEMLAASVDLSDAPDVLSLLVEYGVDASRFQQAVVRQPPVIDDNPMYVRDYAKCVLCWRCVQVCAADAQYTYAINFSGRGFHTAISTFYEKPLLETTCVFCGQCVGVCPTGALKPRRQWLLEQGIPPDQVAQLTRTEQRKQRKP
jgi:NADH dehydrogenase/NADH:ubiquinone oxidoreductase subunit G